MPSKKKREIIVINRLKEKVDKCDIVVKKEVVHWKKRSIFVVNKEKIVRKHSTYSDLTLAIVGKRLVDDDKEIKLEEIENKVIIWYEIAEELHLNKYLVSKCGKIYSKRFKKVISYVLKSGYLVAVLYSNSGKIKNIFAHKVVATTFIPNPDGKPTVDHINQVRSDNNVDNLRWANSKEQAANRKYVNNVGKARLVDQFEVNNTYIKTWSSLKEVKLFYTGKPYADIRSSLKDFSKTAYGYKWAYKKIEELQGELWKQIEDYHDYFVSSFGRIKKVCKIGEKLIKPRIAGDYFCTRVSNKYHQTHIWVCTVFHGNKPTSKHQVNHKDGNTINNYADNLEWCTPQQNVVHAIATGLKDTSLSGISNTKKIFKYSLDGKFISEYKSSDEAANSLNDKSRTDAQVIRKHCNSEEYGYKGNLGFRGYLWSYFRCTFTVKFLLKIKEIYKLNPVYQYTKENIFICKYDDIRDAVLFVINSKVTSEKRESALRASIKKICDKKGKSVYGFIWSYKPLNKDDRIDN